MSKTTEQTTRGKYNRYDENKFESAIKMVKAGECSQRQAAKRYNIPQATLSDHLRGRVLPGT